MNSMTKEQALQRLQEGNRLYLAKTGNPAVLSPEERRRTAREGQTPYAVLVTCSDSRVPPEHIFSAGIGELFVIRTAGHLIDPIILGSVEFGVTALGAPLIVMMGHTKCGAVSAAISGKGSGHMVDVIQEISAGLHGETNPTLCEIQHMKNSLNELKESSGLAPLIASGAVGLVGAMYDVETGAAVFEPLIQTDLPAASL